MNVTIYNKRVNLSDKDVIGMGGEATIFRYKGDAVKVYSQPTPARDRKLRDMIAACAALPNQVIAPRTLTFDKSAKTVVGFTMALLDPNYVEVRRLSTKNYRATSGITAREVTALFLDTWRTLQAIHQAGMVVGDFNDLNLMFNGAAGKAPTEMIFIDTDSFQYGAHPCMVGTEAFLDPLLYGVDLDKAPIFKPEHDWYSFAVLLFKSLLLTHPYGGVHPLVTTLIGRAQGRISVFDAQVKYPRIAYAPELLTDELITCFETFFTAGKRMVFPEAALCDYLNGLRECANCGASYPDSRAQCPICAAASPTPPTPKLGGQVAGSRPIFQAGGNIVAWKVSGETIRLIARENERFIYYRIGNGATQRVVLFDALSNARFTFLEDMIIISPAPDSDDLMVVDCSTGKPVGILKTTTGRYGGNAPMFGASTRHLYRLVGGYLMRGSIEQGNLLEQPVMAAAENQTWIQVAPDMDRVIGCFRVYSAYSFFLLDGSTRIDAAVTPLDRGEVVLSITAYFAPQSVLIARHTQINGVEQVRLDEVDLKGRLANARTVKAEDFDPLEAHAYMTGILLRASDVGIVQERLNGGRGKVFTQTETFVGQGDALCAYQDGLLVKRDDRLFLLTL